MMTGVLYPTPSSQNRMRWPLLARKKAAYRSAAWCQPSSSTKLSSERRFMVSGFPQRGQTGRREEGIFISFWLATIWRMISRLSKVSWRQGVLH